MSAELQALEEAVRDFELQTDLDLIDPKRLAAVIDRLQARLCTVLHRGKQRGDHLLAGKTPVGWVAQTCGLSSSSASDRLCVGEQLESLPRVAQALKSGEVSYQSAAVICHLRDKLREDLRPNIDQEWWLERARAGRWCGWPTVTSSSRRRPRWSRAGGGASAGRPDQPQYQVHPALELVLRHAPVRR